MEATGFVLRPIVALVLFAWTSWAAGRLVGRLLGLPVTTWSFTVALGLAGLAQLALLVGLMDALTPGTVVTIVAVVLASVLGSPAVRSDARAIVNAGLRHPGRAVLLVTLTAPLVVMALYPPLGFDQTLYHLPYSRAFAERGAVSFLPAARYPVFPQLSEALTATVLALAGDVATQMTGLWALVSCLALTVTFTRERSSRAAAWMAPALLAGSPISLYLAATGYVEPLLALLGLASVFAAERARAAESARTWAAAAGLLAGTAAGVKYLGLFFVAFGALVIVRPGGVRISRAHLGAFAVGAALALAPSYGRLVVYTGNPIFPFYPALFGSSAWDADHYLGPRGLARLHAAGTLLWDVSFRRERVGGLPPFSPAFSLGALVALACLFKDSRLRWPVLGGLMFVAVAPVHAHYLFAVAPLWACGIATAADYLTARVGWGGRPLVAAALLLLISGEAYAFYYVHRLGFPPATAAGRERLLARERPLYAALAHLNREHGAVTIYGIEAEHMVYYAAGTLLGDHNGPASFTHVGARARALHSLAAALDEVGAGFLLVPARPSPWFDMAQGDARLVRVHADEHAWVYRVDPVPEASGGLTPSRPLERRPPIGHRRGP